MPLGPREATPLMTAPCLSSTGTKKQVCARLQHHACHHHSALWVPRAAGVCPLPALQLWLPWQPQLLTQGHQSETWVAFLAIRASSLGLRWLLGAGTVGPVVSLGHRAPAGPGLPQPGQGAVPLRLLAAGTVPDVLSHACRQEILPGGDPDEQHGTR